MSDLAKFYRECFNAPQLQQFSEIDESSAAVTSSSPVESCSTVTTSENIKNTSIDDLTKQLEQFETSLGDYDSLVTSLCQQESEVDSNSNS